MQPADYKEFEQSMAQRKLVQDPEARYLRNKIWTMKCQWEHDIGYYDMLPRDENGTPFVLPMPDRSDFRPIVIVTQEEQREKDR